MAALLPLSGLSALYLQPNQPPGTVGLAWDLSPDPSAVGTKIYYGTSPRVYTSFYDAGTKSACNIDGLVRGITYYFTAVAYTSDGLESDFSNEVFATPPRPPAPIPDLTATNVPVARVALQSAPSPSGPFKTFAEVGGAELKEPGYFRSVVTIDKGSAGLTPGPMAKATLNKKTKKKMTPPLPAK